MPVLLTFAVVLAQTGGTSDGLPDWAKYGLLGLVVLALATGQLLVPAYIYKAAIKRAEEAEARERALLEGTVSSVETGLRETRDVLGKILEQRGRRP